MVSFEFAEEAASGRVGRIAPYMERLREQGVSFALDNFGRGISSLANVNSLPVSAIKIDGALCRSLVANPRARSLVVAIAKLAQGVGLETVATSVETDAIRGRAAECGVDFGQGFFIGKPQPLGEVISDLPLYTCFSTSTGLFDFGPAQAAVQHG